MKLFLGIPTGGSPAAGFLESVARMEVPDGVRQVARLTCSGNFVPAQRELIAHRALAWGADILAMIDDDMILPSGALVELCATLIADPRCAMVGALYYSRDGFRPMAVDGWKSEATASGWIPAFDDRTPVCVDGVGFGCVAIRVASMATLPRPIFRTQVYVEEAAARVRICNEDYLFCASLRAIGYGILLHPGVRCGHYDRATGRTVPEEWPPPEVTNAKRMAVRLPDGTAELVPLEQRVATVRERHVTASLEYIFVDDAG